MPIVTYPLPLPLLVIEDSLREKEALKEREKEKERDKERDKEKDKEKAPLSRTLKSIQIRGVPKSEFSGSQKRG